MTTFYRHAYIGGPVRPVRHGECGGPDCEACDLEQEMAERDAERRNQPTTNRDERSRP